MDAWTRVCVCVVCGVSVRRVLTELGVCGVCVGVVGRRKEKLRRLNWEKVPDGKVEGTIFADIHNSGSGTTAVAARTPKRVAFLAHRRKSKSAAAKAEAGDLHSSCGGGGGSDEVEIDIEALTDLFALKNNASTSSSSSSSSSSTNKKRPGSRFLPALSSLLTYHH